ncbi:MAG TPA: hypothetical protein DCZ11_06675 [Gammaproteobacteria bacterium]|nr:hypothetical protein [Gammaproteobacteria bacterium]MCH78110.1 hypothetical protein [Gammaproteobacteria bacterium]
MANRYADVHNRIAANPAPIDRCVRRLVSEIERFARHRDRMIACGEWHPHQGAEQLYELRSTLIHLQRLQQQERAAPTEHAA